MSGRDPPQPCFMGGQFCDAAVQTREGWVCTPCVRVCVEVTVGQLEAKRAQTTRR